MNDDDIKEVMAEERSRGRRRVDPAARKAFQKLKREASFLLSIRDVRLFNQELLRLGVKPGTPDYEAALQAWREFSST